MKNTAEKYTRVELGNNKYVIVEAGRDWKRPAKAITATFDTETLVYLDGQIQPQHCIYEKLKKANENEKRQRLFNDVWAWQCYDEINGFFMTNDFDLWLSYQCKTSYKYVWCYNATFDFAQIDYKILAEQKEKWRPHQKNSGHGYDKGQAWTYESIHNDMGARYAYKLWIYYTAENRHKHVHAVEYRDFAKIINGGLASVLESLNVHDNDGNELRKLTMNYQAVNVQSLTDSEIDYCCIDVKGLYFAIKQFNETLENETNNELHCFGKDTNVMTAGGIAKRELLRSMYPDVAKSKRLQTYQREHVCTAQMDEYVRSNHLYRGGISFVNPKYKGKLLTREKMRTTMKRYDVNSEYPYAMSIMRDLIEMPVRVSYDWWLNNKSDDYECILELTSVRGTLKKNMVGLWYDHFRNCYVDDIDENYLHLMYEEEFNEFYNWYDELEFSCESCIIIKRGDFAYKKYVDNGYEKKAQAKKDKNAVMQALQKLLLNSSYGKLAERVERQNGHYELNEDTGAIHFVADNVEIDEKSIMSIFCGAKVTSIARTYIMTMIRSVCKNVRNEFVYIDTDSIHAFCELYDGADAYRLGALKLEAECDVVKYILPKTYIDIEHVNGNIVDRDSIEAHSKGLSVSAIKNEFKRVEKENKQITLIDVSQLFEYGKKYVVLQAMNVRGGKVLIPTDKYIAREEQSPDFLINQGYYNER